MIIESKGIIISTRNFEERYLIVQCFLQKYGLMSGLTRNHKSTKSNCITGNVVAVRWYARTREQLGSYQFELISNTVSAIAFNRTAITIVNSLIAMLISLLHEREPQIQLFNAVEQFLSMAQYYQLEVLLRQYLIFEQLCLKTSGFGLDLTKCRATEVTTDLFYISPKSGAAISRQAGLPYHDRMILLPQSMLEYDKPLTIAEFLTCLQITEFFIEKHLLLPYGKKMPDERKLMIKLLEDKT